MIRVPPKPVLAGYLCVCVGGGGGGTGGGGRGAFATMQITVPASILYESIAGRYWPVSYPYRPITARCRFIKNAYRVVIT